MNSIYEEGEVNTMHRIVIIGAGLVGSVLAIFFSKRGFKVDVYDRLPDIREQVVSTGKSFNLTLCDRGFRTLDSVGVGDIVRSISVPARGRMVHDIKGNLSLQPYGNNGEAIYSLSRNDLYVTLLEFAERHFDIGFYFNEKCAGIDLAKPCVDMKNLKTGETTRQEAFKVFGADGAHSAVRMQLQKTKSFNFSQQYSEHGYKELHVPAMNSGWTEEKNVLHFWPRGNSVMIGFPNTDGTFTCSLYMPFEGKTSFDSIRTEADLLTLFEEWFPDLIRRMPNLAEEYFANPPNTLLTIRCGPWSFQDKVLLIGDAAHAILPFYGQGANAGFEDCTVLQKCIDEYGSDWKSVFREYEMLRRPDMDAIADLCAEHFVNLRDRVGERAFLLRREVERKINQMYPDRYRDLYSMITFTCMRYTEALRIDREQSGIIDLIMNMEGIEEKLRTSEADHLISELMQLQTV